MDINQMKRQMEAVQNLIKLTEASEKLHKSGDLNCLTKYGNWLMELGEGADSNDPKITEELLDQLIRVAPKLTNFIEECVKISDAITDEMEGNANDIFFIDDSFFDVDDNTDDANDGV